MYENENVQIYMLFCMSRLKSRQNVVKYESEEGSEREEIEELRGKWLVLGGS